MVRPLCHDPILLRMVAAPATKEDLPLVRDVTDTLKAHREGCVGMAANMIGVPKCVIAFFDGDVCRVMLNPQIVEKSGPYEAEEGCLSWSGIHTATRFRLIQVKYQTETFAWKKETFMGWTAEIIQHEIDHLAGKQI